MSRRDVMIGAGGLTSAWRGVRARPGTYAARVARAERDQPMGHASCRRHVASWLRRRKWGRVTDTLPLVLAEEIDADWAKVRVVSAPPDDKTYGNPGVGGIMYTAGASR